MNSRQMMVSIPTLACVSREHHISYHGVMVLLSSGEGSKVSYHHYNYSFMFHSSLETCKIHMIALMFVVVFLSGCQCGGGWWWWFVIYLFCASCFMMVCSVNFSSCQWTERLVWLYWLMCGVVHVASPQRHEKCDFAITSRSVILWCGVSVF